MCFIATLSKSSNLQLKTTQLCKKSLHRLLPVAAGPRLHGPHGLLLRLPSSCSRLELTRYRGAIHNMLSIAHRCSHNSLQALPACNNSYIHADTGDHIYESLNGLARQCSEVQYRQQRYGTERLMRRVRSVFFDRMKTNETLTGRVIQRWRWHSRHRDE